MGLKPVEWTLTLLVASLAAYCIRKHVITAEEEQQDPNIPDRCPGCPRDADIDEDVLAAASAATAALTSSSAVTGSCPGSVKLINVENVRTQVVAGTNFHLSLRLAAKTGENCQETVEKICSKIVVYKPLPFNCKNDDGSVRSDGCLELIRQDEITCSSGSGQPRDLQQTLFSDISDASTATIAQCSGEGKKNCKKIEINQNVWDNLQPGAKVKLLPQLDITLSLRTEPTRAATSRSYSFAIEKNGQLDGEATITIGNTGSVFGSVKPDNGDVHYIIESCGNNCNILAERAADYFNNFED